MPTGWFKNGTPVTLGAGALEMNITDLTDGIIFNQFICHTFDAVAQSIQWRWGDAAIDTGNNYAERYEQDDAADATDVSRASLFAYYQGADFDRFNVWYGINIASKEKLFYGCGVTTSANGAASAPNRIEVAGKWVDTTDQYTRVRVFSHSGNMPIGSNLSALGSVT